MKGVYIELMFTYFALQRWKANPTASKQEIGLRSYWKVDSPENRLPLSQAEVAFLAMHAPSMYRGLFTE